PVLRERQLAGISAFLREPTSADYPDRPRTLARAKQAFTSVLPTYTRYHVEVLASDQERADVLAAITIGRRGEQLLDGDMLARLTEYVRNYEPWLSGTA